MADSTPSLSPELLTALDASDADPDRAWSLPPALYTDLEAFDVERDRIFRRGWVGIGRSDRWAVPHACSAVDIGGISVLITRGDDAVLRAFANVCRHRGAELLVQESTCARIRCPFHGWTYGLDGRLVSAPNMTRTEDFDRADHGLHAFAVAERHGFAFVNLSNEPESIDDWTAGYGSIHAGWAVDSMVTTSRREFSVDCNWKLFAEVFNEYYHLPWVHPGSIDSTYCEPDAPDVVDGAFATQFGATDGTGGLLDDDADQALPLIATLAGREQAGVRYTWIYPNIVTAVGVECMWMYEVYPDGPSRCRVAQVVCFPAATVDRADFEDRAQAYYERFDVAISEDVPVLERQQAGLSSPFATAGRFSHLEPCVALFGRWYGHRMR
ncbi:MAG: aromatic ring-hydroxylating oxygenase subunit alpha [Acidimicrobiales bacterium]